MEIPLYHINTFTGEKLLGNPAAVCLLPKWLTDKELQWVARENNLPVTAFLVREKENFYIRCLTPEYELDICGHGTLAAAYIVFTFLKPNCRKINLFSRQEMLVVGRTNNLITLNFAASFMENCKLPLLFLGLGSSPTEVYQYKRQRCVAIYKTSEQIERLQPNMQILRQLKHRGITVSALGVDVDFVSRTFYPHKQESEDSVTGTAHCLLVPYWSVRLNKTQLHARQVSPRGGEIFCGYQAGRVLLSGAATVTRQGIFIVKGD